MQLIKILSHRLKSLVLDNELDISVNVIAFHGCKNNALEVKDYDGAHCRRQPSIACVSSRRHTSSGFPEVVGISRHCLYVSPAGVFVSEILVKKLMVRLL